MRVILLAALTAVAGCATTETVWNKSGTTERDFNMDRGQCRAQALGIANVTVYQATLVFASCMEGKGYSQEERPIQR